MIRWGIAGPGGIAANFADAMTRVDDGQIVAVASRSAERADAFGDRFGVAGRHADYESLAGDPDVDAVYVATPASRHATDTLLYVGAGKHVLCEKPFALSAAQGRKMIEAAATANVFLMEAMWSRFVPAYRAIVDLIGSGRIGTAHLVEANLGIAMPFEPGHRLFDLEQGGGALLDLGIYPIHLSQLALGPIQTTVAEGVLGQSGVDERVAAVLTHEGGGIGVVSAAISTNLSCTARINGADGFIELPPFMQCPTSLSLGGPGGALEVIEYPLGGNGFEFQIAEVHRCLEERRAESATMPLGDTLALATAMDDIRAQIGLVYPREDT